MPDRSAAASPRACARIAGVSWLMTMQAGAFAMFAGGRLVAGVGRIGFIALVLVHGRSFLGHQAGAAIVVDSIMVALFAVYLIAVRRRTS